MDECEKKSKCDPIQTTPFRGNRYQVTFGVTALRTIVLWKWENKTTYSEFVDENLNLKNMSGYISSSTNRINSMTEHTVEVKFFFFSIMHFYSFFFSILFSNILNDT